jgi:hypothetical protein
MTLTNFQCKNCKGKDLTIDATENENGTFNEPVFLVCRDCLRYEKLESIGEGFGQ